MIGTETSHRHSSTSKSGTSKHTSRNPQPSHYSDPGPPSMAPPLPRNPSRCQLRAQRNVQRRNIAHPAAGANPLTCAGRTRLIAQWPLGGTQKGTQSPRQITYVEGTYQTRINLDIKLMKSKWTSARAWQARESAVRIRHAPPKSELRTGTRRC